MPKINSVLLLGSTGMLGGHLLNAFNSTSIKVVNPQRSEVNLDNYKYLKNYIFNCNVDLVVNCISQNGINACFDDKLNAFTVNSLYPQFLSQVCEELNLKLILFSSEMVFDDLNYPANLKSNPEPSTTYGLTKYFGEVNNGKNTIIRLPLLVSKQKNNQIVWKLLDKLSKENIVKVSDDEYSTPVFAEDVAYIILKILLKEILPSGYIHFASSKRITLYETVYKFTEYIGIDSSKLLKCKASDFPAKELKPRKSGLEASHEFSSLKFL